MKNCNIAPLHQLGICHNNVTVDNTFPFRLRYKINEILIQIQIRIQVVNLTLQMAGFLLGMYVCILYVCMYH
jgi:hypothetical protein